MFNFKRIFLLFIFIIGILLSLQNIKIFYSVLTEILSGKNFSILLTAWPLVLGWLIYAVMCIYLTILSWNKMSEIDKTQVSVSGITASQKESRFFNSVEVTPLVKFGVYFGAIILVISILTSLSKFIGV